MSIPPNRPSPAPAHAPADEHDLLVAAVAGDAAALEHVARAWRDRIRRWALLELGDPSLAEDAAQDTLVALVHHIGRYDPARPFGPWLRGVVRNCCHRVRRSQRRHAYDPLEALTRTAPPALRALTDPEAALDVERRMAATARAFASLTPREREVMDLCAADGLSAAEAARSLGIAASTARVLLFRARERLLARLGGFFHHDEGAVVAPKEGR